MGHGWLPSYHSFWVSKNLAFLFFLCGHRQHSLSRGAVSHPGESGEQAGIGAQSPGMAAHCGLWEWPAWGTGRWQHQQGVGTAPEVTAPGPGQGLPGGSCGVSRSGLREAFSDSGPFFWGSQPGPGSPFPGWTLVLAQGLWLPGEPPWAKGILLLKVNARRDGQHAKPPQLPRELVEGAALGSAGRPARWGRGASPEPAAWPLRAGSPPLKADVAARQAGPVL